MSFALVLAKNVHLSIGEEVCAFPCQNFAPQFLTFWNALSSHFPLPKTLHFSKQFVFCALSNGVIDRGSKQQSTRSNFRLHRSSFSSKKSKKWIKLIPKTIGNRKRDCAWGYAWGINTTWENLQIEKHKSGRRSFRAPQYWRRVLRFSLPKFCTSVSHLLKCAEFTLSIAKNVALFETVRILRTVNAEALPILCVRYIRWEREREIQREREKDGSDVTIFALKLAMSFALVLAKNVHLSIGEEVCAFPCQNFAPQFLTFWNALSSHFPLPKTLHFSKQFVFFALSNGVIYRGSKQQSTRSNFRLHRSSFSSKKSKTWIKLIPKTIGNRKRDCAWGYAWGINTTWENLQIEKHKSGRRSFRAPQYWRRVLRFSLPKFCTSVSHLLKCAEFTLSIAKNVALFETVRILRTVKWRDWQGIEAAKHTIEFPAAPFFFLVEKIEKMNQINTKNYWK